MTFGEIDKMVVTQQQCDDVGSTVYKLGHHLYDEITPEEFWIFLHFYDIGEYFENPKLEAQLLKRYGVECGCERCLGES